MRTRSLTLFAGAALLVAVGTAEAGGPIYLNGNQDAPAMYAIPYGGPSGFTPYQYTPLAGSQYNQAATSATSLTSPAGALFARICAVGGQMNFTEYSGDTPVAGSAPTAGTVLQAGACIYESGASVLSGFKIINAVASVGTWTGVYFK